jgi:pimeloyl-ACP methyl ester carboxylesterase
VLDGLGVRSTRLLALSQGGWIALRFATTWPERVEKLALLAPAGVVRDRLSFLLRVAPLFFLGRRGARAMVRVVAGRAPMSPEALVFMEAILTHVRPQLYSFPLFSSEELRRLEMPVLLVGGGEDAIRDCQSIASRLQGLLPRFEARILPEAGHALMKVAPIVAPFLEQP